MYLPQFRGGCGLDQGIWSEGILLSVFVSFCESTAAGGEQQAILDRDPFNAVRRMLADQ
jgi:hypothetical protein